MSINFLFSILSSISLQARCTFLLTFITFIVASQQRCGTDLYNQMMRNNNLVLEREDQFEQWLMQNMRVKKSKNVNQRSESEPYQIRVVVHVIHNGEALGQATNIADAQIRSQIEVLNNDFKRLNADAINTPSEFQSLAGSVNIEFVLANQDPEGLPSSGINRVKGTKTSWTIQDNKDLKSLSYWSSTHYLNIWVCNLTDYLGYTQFPVSTIPGLENSPANQLTDGIIIWYKAFGSTDAGNFNLDPSYNKGRTTTHEMGHFLGLRHLWGEKNDCTGNDYVEDTPPQHSSMSGCPSHPQKQCPSNNPVSAMFQNFLDFTDDNCQNLFTKGQVDRMITVLENSPRRSSLLLPLPDAGTDEAGQFQDIFSPNGDGVNDFWKWSNYSNYEGCQLIIFNRFGKQEFEMISYDGRWDGRSSTGQLLEEEAYYFIIKCNGKKDVTDGVRIVR